MDLSILRYFPDFRRFSVPSPAFTDIVLSIGRERFSFERHDFSFTYPPFFSDINLPSNLQISRPVIETNRCFFIHLGVAVLVHPFVLQTSFRSEAQSRLTRLRSDADNVADIMYKSVLEYAGIIDANVLCYLWPEEFDEYVICIISGSLNRPIFSVFRPSYSSTDYPIEIIIHCEHDHFTLLKPVSARKTSFKVLSFRCSDGRAKCDFVSRSSMRCCVRQGPVGWWCTSTWSTLSDSPSARCTPAYTRSGMCRIAGCRSEILYSNYRLGPTCMKS